MSDDLSLLNIIICDSKIQNKKFVFKQIFFKKETCCSKTINYLYFLIYKIYTS